MALPAPKPETREMAVQTESEYTSTGVGSPLLQYASIAIGSPTLEYTHTNIGTTPEPEPMLLPLSSQDPATTQTAILEAPRLPTPEFPAAPPAEAEPSTTEVTFFHLRALFFLTDIS